MAKKILVVDDDPEGLALLSGRLRKAGFDVLCEKNGQAGMDRIFKDHPDLVILDIEMPEMNGFMFVTVLKKIEEFKSTPVIVLTAHEENKPIFARKGISHYLVKPVNFDELFKQITELIGLQSV
jgi:DNA-binding response OmpR family regulator